MPLKDKENLSNPTWQDVTMQFNLEYCCKILEDQTMKYLWQQACFIIHLRVLLNPFTATPFKRVNAAVLPNTSAIPLWSLTGALQLLSGLLKTRSQSLFFKFWLLMLCLPLYPSLTRYVTSSHKCCCSLVISMVRKVKPILFYFIICLFIFY